MYVSLFLLFFVFLDAPSLEGLTRHLSGGKLQPGLFLTLFSSYFEKFSYILYRKDKLFDIARRVPFLAMTIVQKNDLDGPWFFRTQPLQTGATQSTREVSLELTQSPASVSKAFPTYPMFQYKQLQQQKQSQKHLQAPSTVMPSMQVKKIPVQQHFQHIQNIGVRLPPGFLSN